MSDAPTIVRFYQGWKQGETGPDGLPLFYEVIMIRLDRPPYLSVQREAEPFDFEEHRMAFELFQKEQSSRKVTLAEGYPLALWPACTEALFKMLADREIYTVQQLAKANKKDMPAEIRELAERAQKMMELQKGGGKYEELLRDRDGRISALEESLSEATKTIAGQKALIDTLKVKVAV